MKIKVGDTVEIVSLVEMCGPSDLKLRGRPNGREVGIMYVRDCATVLERKNVEGLVWCKLRTEHTQQEGWCLQLDLRRLDKKELEWKLERLNRPLARAGDVLLEDEDLQLQAPQVPRHAGERSRAQLVRRFRSAQAARVAPR